MEDLLRPRIKDLNTPKILIGKKVVISGFLGPPRALKGLTFVPLQVDNTNIQLVLSSKDEPEAYNEFVASNINNYSAVEVCGTVKSKPGKNGQPDSIEVLVSSIKTLAEFPGDILTGEVAKYGPEQRHLQLRFDEELADRLRFRSHIVNYANQHLIGQGFTQVDTPILFKSTPEGAREFLVPTRTAGLVYALPQSPQQYKQILMASGVAKYFQLAHCFRDEDLRADRQPEFMQLDLEMAFARGEDVMGAVERLVKRLWKKAEELDSNIKSFSNSPFPRMTYTEAMSMHGVDKPDLRIKNLVRTLTRRPQLRANYL